MRLLPIVLLLVFSLEGISQSSNITLVYRLSNEAYEQKIRSDTFKLTPADCQFLVGNDDTLNNLEPGYYIYASANQEDLQLSLIDYTTLSTIVLNNERDFAIQVLDTAGQLLNANVWLNNKSIKYDAATKSYRLPKHKKGGLLKVAAQGQVVFYEVEEENIYRYNRHFQQTRFGYYVMTPVRWSKNIYRYFREGFQYDNWHINWKRLNPIKPKPKLLKGYIALNKPIYRHDNTLQLKAYVADNKGKYWKKKLKLSIQEDGGYGNFVIDTTVLTNENGSIIFNLLLTDSLQLDKNYYITIKDATSKYNNGLSHTFKLEDYQLDEVDYTFSSTQPAYQKGEKIILTAEGKDKNGFTIPDGEVKIVALRGNLKSTDVAELRIPDTMWTYTQALDTRDATQIIFPDSLLPNAELDIQFKATFTNSNGELHEKMVNVSYAALLRTIKMELQNGYIIADYKEGEKSVPIDAELEISGVENIDFIKTVQLPLKEKLHPFADYYTITIDKNIWQSLSVGDEEASVAAFGNYIKDSVFINITNPHQIPVNYWISKGENIIKKGQTSEAQFQWQHEDKSQRPYHLRYQYLWDSETESRDIIIQSFKNILNIEVEQSTKVLPGAQTQVKVKVNDQQNKKVQGVNLTAGAVNAQFNSAGSFSPVQIDYKRIKPLKKYENFELDRQTHFNRKHPLTKEWLKKFQLQDQLYYQLRFAEKSFYAHYDTITSDSFYRNVAQFSPYVVNKGQSQPIIMIYCNRKLVYYYEADNNTPYSFVEKEGYNLITIRTPKYEYWIDSVLLKKGQKLEFSIDETGFAQDTLIHRKPMPDSLTQPERTLLKGKMLLLLKKSLALSTYYLWQNSSAIHSFTLTNDTKRYDNTPIIFGPFNLMERTHYVEQNSFRSQFLFESGFEYTILPRRERLYASQYFDKKMPLPKKLAPKKPGQIVYKPSDIQYIDQNLLINIPLQSYFRNGVDTGGIYQFFYKPTAEKHLIALALVKDSSTLIDRFQPNITLFEPLPVGNYTLTLVNNLHEIYRQKVEIKLNTLLYHNFSNIIWQQDTVGIVAKLFHTTPLFDKNDDIGWQEQFDIPNALGNVIQGYILDESGEPLIGANVWVKGTTTGTATDIDGYYSITIPYDLENLTIVVSYTGFNTSEVDVNKNNSIVDVKLDDSGAALSEVVVTGYGIASSKNLTSSISSVSIDNLQAQAAGLTINPSDIQIRGSRSLGEYYYIDGVRMDNNAKAKLDLSNPELLQSSGIRSNFKDYAYWQPNLITDQNGEAYFTVTYPDNITSWNTFVLGMDRKLRAGVAYGSTKSYKPLLAQLAMPRFLVEGDETDIIGKSVNYTNDTLAVATSFKIGDQLLQENKANVTDGLIEKANIITPAQQDSLQVTYTLQMGEYLDGEQRSIPIFRKGLEETNGYFYVLNKDTSFTLKPLHAQGNAEIYVENNALHTILRDIEGLKDYPYGCNEQTASRLLALLMDKKISEQLGKKYTGTKNITAMIERLEKSQNKDGSWGWWSGNDWNHWMTVYVTSAFHEAKKAGFQSKALEKALQFITSNTKELHPSNLVYTLHLLAESEVPFDFEASLARLDKMDLDLYEQFMSIRVKQKLGWKYTLDSLYKHQQKDIFGSVFWAQEDSYWYSKTMHPTLLAYEILRAAGKKEQLSPIRQYFLQQKRGNARLGWDNTFKTALVLQTILPELLEENAATNDSTTYLSINGTKISGTRHRATYTANQDLTIVKSGNTPLFFTAYQHFFNPNPAIKDSLFTIKTTLYQDGKPVAYLKQGEKVTLKVEVHVKTKTEYVMLEIPIPASCSYSEKSNGWRFPEVHREYFKEKTAIFCQELPEGNYTFSIELEPRFTGNYTLNPVKVEQMYFPVFNGNNELKKVRVE